MVLWLRTLAHPFLPPSVLLGFVGKHLLLLLRGCDDKDILYILILNAI